MCFCGGVASLVVLSVIEARVRAPVPLAHVRTPLSLRAVVVSKVLRSVLWFTDDHCADRVAETIEFPTLRATVLSFVNESARAAEGGMGDDGDMMV